MIITKFSIFKESINFKDMKNILDLNLDQTKKNDNKSDNNEKDANLKITDIQNKISQINDQKKLINDEIIRLQDAKRDLMPNNTNDPNYSDKMKIFNQDQLSKINIQKDKISILDKEIDNLQKEIERIKSNYL